MAKIAIKRVRKDDKGKLIPYYIDAETLQPLSNIDGYQVINPDGTPEFSGFDAIAELQGGFFGDYPKTPTPEKKTATDRVIKKDRERQERGGEGSFGKFDGKKGTSKGNVGNNFGYINKPDWMGLTGFLPGPAGTVGKLANVAVNANNLAATNKARAYLGLDPVTTKDTLKGLVKDQKGFIDRVKINNEEYDVGFEAMHKGNTTLTPEEARTRALTLGGLESVSNNKKGLAGVVTDAMFSGTPINSEADLTKAMAEHIAQGNNTRRNLERPRQQYENIDPQTVGYAASYGPHRPNAPKQDIIDNIKTSVGNVYGPGASVVGISGMGEYGSHRHRKGDALDFDVYDAYGARQTNNIAMQDVAMDFAARNPDAGVGFGPGYMADGRMHLDTADDPAQWGANNTHRNLDPNFEKNLDFARQTGIGPTPTFNAPTPTARGMDAGPPTATGDDLSPTAHTGVTSGDVTSAVGSYARSVVRDTVQKDKFAGLPSMSPAEMASKGLITRTPREMEQIAKTVVGELSGSALKGLAAGEEMAHKELANMVTAIENRVASNLYNNNLGNVLTAPSQFNALDPKAISTTMDNWSKYGAVTLSKVQSYYTPNGIKPDDFSFTSFHANSMQNPPGWSGVMSNATLAGEHVFGTLDTYGPNKGFMAERDRLSQGQISDTRGWTPSSTAGAFAGRTADSRGTFGTDRSPGVGRSSFAGGGGAYSDRSGGGSFGTTSSPGYGRSSFSGGSDGGYGRSSPEGGGGGRSSSSGGVSGRGPSGFGGSSSPGAGRGSISGGSGGSHPGASSGHSGVAGGAGGHSGSANDRGGYAGL